ncbi:MAG: PCMD domain-containing protein [Muribaculaceae bacterium]|nr:PCMD domain-containing protein [Muribaculaceae bacterium]
MKKIVTAILTTLIAASPLSAQKTERIKYGDFEQWVTRIIPESRVIGGNHKTLYEIAPDDTIEGNKPYTNKGGSPWATSNVLANVMGVVKGSNAVFPDKRSSNNKCARLSCIMEHCKAIGIINIDVVVAGSIFLGEFLEPVKNTKEPYSKMEMGIPFTKRPSALKFDYKLEIPQGNTRTYSSGFGKKKTLTGSDCAEVYIILQRRWEDANGNIYAKRVGTGRQHLTKSTNGWVNNHRIPVWYGDITSRPDYKPYMGLIEEEKSYYAKNSKGKMVPVKETGWDNPDATPTHMLIMASAGSGTAYIGTIGLNLWVDNFSLVYP